MAKPSGLIVHRGWGRDEHAAVDLVVAAIGRAVHPLHRLDRGTSGVLLFALDLESARSVGEAFASGAVEKRYLGLARGRVPQRLEIDHPLRRLDQESGRKDGLAEFLPARTEIECLRMTELRGRTYSLVEARPRSGRTHQIRRHLKHVSHPLVGDVRWGKGAINRVFREEVGLHRLALHAASLRFQDRDGRWLEISAPFPADLAEPFARLGL